MAISISVPNQVDPELRPRITVVGVGGAGGNAVNNMIRSNLEGVEFIVTNTDAQALTQSLAPRKFQLGTALTRGLGAGSRPDVGRAAAEEVIAELMEELNGSNMVFITAGMGGGTGTGAAPVIARVAREHGILTVGVVTKPFQFEGAHRMRLAESGIQELQAYVDTLIVIPNQNLFRLANERTTFADAFKMADDVLHSGVRGVTDLMVMPGLINLDFADIRAVMGEMGKAMMGTGEAEGDRRALDAAEAAISNPLLEDTSMKGARGVLINITGGYDMTLFEVDEAANRIRDEVDPDANIIFGSTFDEKLEGKMRVSVVATGIEAEAMAEPRRPAISLVADRTKPGFQPGQPAGGIAAAAIASQAVATGAFVGATAMGQSATTASVPGQPMQQGLQQPRYDVHGNAAIAPQPMVAPASIPAAIPPMVRPGALRSEAASTRPAMPARPEARIQEEPFIAPRPVEPQFEPMPAAPAERQPDPFAAAAVTNGYPAQPRAERQAQPAAPAPAPAPVAEKPRAPSLFERVTRRIPAAPKQAAAPAPRVTAPTPPAAAQQPRLGSLDPGERLTQSQNDDDLLDIPAFLRRQAN
jgi:cell division protein FtsZ